MLTLPTLCISRDACSPLSPIFFTFSCKFRKKTGSLYLGSPGSKNLRYRLELHDYTWDTHHLIAIFCSGTHTHMLRLVPNLCTRKFWRVFLIQNELFIFPPYACMSFLTNKCCLVEIKLIVILLRIFTWTIQYRRKFLKKLQIGCVIILEFDC